MCILRATSFLRGDLLLGYFVTYFGAYSHSLKNFFRWYHWVSAKFEKYIWWYDK